MSSPTLLELLARLRRLDIDLWIEEDRLRYSAPQGALTPALKAELVERKADIIQFLRQASEAAAGLPTAIQPAPWDEPLPLSFAQQRLWFLDQLEPDSFAYNEPVAFRFTGSLNVAALEQTLQEIIRRHESLRTTFVTSAGQPGQVIHPPTPFSLPRLDITTAANPEAEAQQYIKKELLCPFDLAAGPLWRMTLLQLGPDEHLLLVVMHHIITDGWSMGIFSEELATLYDYFTRASTEENEDNLVYPLPELPVQYADYAYWQRQWLQGSILEAQAAYWQGQLSGDLPLLQLPTDYPRPAAQTFHGATHVVILPQQLAEALHHLGQQHGVTLFMTLLTAFKILLYRYTGQPDILVGVPAANRNRSQLEKLIGFFVNTLVLRTRLQDDPTFQELLSQVRRVALEAYAHQDFPFEKLIEQLQPERSLSRQPLFQVMFAFENTPAAAPVSADEASTTPAFQFPGLQIAPVSVETQAARFDLTLFVEETSQGLTLTWEYNTGLFEAATIARMARHYQTLLAGIVSPGGVEQRLSALPLLTETEQHQLLVAWNDTQTDYPAGSCFHHLFETQAAHTPEAIAVIFEEQKQAAQKLTYQALNERANLLAHHLQKSGVGPETPVGVCVERSPEMMIGLLAILKAGGAYVPLDPNYPPRRLAFMIEDSRISVLLTQRRLIDRLKTDNYNVEDEAISPRLRLFCLDTDWDSVDREHIENPASPVTPDNLAYIIYTSGSTGRPKGVMISHRGLVNYLSWAGRAYPIAEGQGAPVYSSLSFDLTITGLFLPLLAGRTVRLVPEDQTGEALAETLRLHPDFSLVKITPAHLELLSHLLPPESAATAARSLIIGGEALLGDHITFWQRYAPHTRLINEYGPTETVVGCCVYELSPGESFPGPIPIGRPIANTRLYLLDRQLQPVPAGVPAELYIGGAGVARGYLNRPGLTAERFIPDPFSSSPGARLYKTGDLARYRPDGVLEFLGRLDHQVKLRGFRIELGEIELVLNQHPAVKEAVVLAREAAPEPARQQLVAYLVPDPADSGPLTNPAPDSLATELRRFLQARLPDYMVPAVYILLEALPLTPNGKIDQRALPDLAEFRSRRAGGAVAPQTEAETILAHIWADLLSLDRVGIYDNFFELGGDSILSIQVIARANQAGLRLTPRQLFQHQTVAELAAVAGETPVVRTEQGPVTGPLPLTPIQRWFFEKNLSDPHHWNMAMMLEAQQPVDPDRLEQALRHLFIHHDALRLRFQAAEDGWQQHNAGPDEAWTALTRSDLSDLSPAEQDAAIEAGTVELQSGLNICSGPLLRVALFQLGSSRLPRLLIVVHHLAIDGVSWRILLEDLQTAYHQLGRGQAIRLPAKTTSFKAWAESLENVSKQQGDQVGSLDPNYWLTSLQSQPPPLPVDYPADEQANSVASADTVSVTLEPAETRLLLQEVPEVYHTQINDLLLTALTQTFADWTGSPRLLIDLEGHGREEIVAGLNLSRTAGWFTTIFPVLLDLAGIARPGEAIKSVKEQLRAIPDRGIGYGLLRYLGPETIRQKLKRLPQAQVSFNYLGQFDQTLSAEALFKPARETEGPTINPANRRAYLLEINGFILGGSLQVEWTYSRNIHRRATIESLARRFIETLQALIAHCQSPEAGGYTPSDFPEADLSQAELDDLLAGLDD